MNCFLRKITSHLSLNYLKLNSYNQSIVCVKHLNTLNNHILRSQTLTKCLSQMRYQSIIRTISTSHEISLFTNKLSDTFVDQKRYKKGKKKSKQTKDENSDEDSDEEQPSVDEFDPDLIDGKAIGFSDKDTTLVSLRLDNVLKTGVGIPRTKADEAFYNNMIRVNGERVSKKSAELTEGDEIDLIRGLNQDNQDLIDVNRVIIKKIEDKMSSKDRIRAKLRVFRNLTIENYATDPYDGYAVNIIRAEEDKK